MFKPTMTRRRLHAVLGLGTWSVAVTLLTLTPTGGSDTPSIHAFLCVWCTVRPGADLLLNWLLFVPGGFFLRQLTGVWTTLALGFAATSGIEAAQLLLPGRHSTLSDILLNTAGVATGAWLSARGITSRALGFMATAGAFAWLAPALLLLPVPTAAPLYGLWTPAFGGTAHYDGSVAEARFGGHFARWRIEDTPAVAEALADREAIEVSFSSGSVPPTVAPLVGLYDENQVENLVIGIVGVDLLMRQRTVASVLGFDQPDIRWHGALAGLAVGDAAALRVDRGLGSVCASLDGVRRCGLAPSPGDGYAFFLNLADRSARLRAMMAALWSLGIGLLVGLPLSGASRGTLAGAALGAAGLLIAALSPDIRPDLLHTALVLVGSTAGGAVPATEWSGVEPREPDEAHHEGPGRGHTPA